MKPSYVLPCYIPDQEIIDLTRATINSFVDAVPDAEIVIADDGSPIGGEFLRSVADTYIKTKKNKGYVPTVNQAIKLATGDVLAISNNDIRVASNWWAVTEEILKDKTIGSVHYKMIKYHRPMSFGDKVWKTGKERWCTTSFVSVRREVYDKIGLVDEGFGRGGYDDWDFWHRVREAGYKTAYTNKSCYQHKDSSVTGKEDRDKWWAGVEKNKEYFKKKWGKSPEKLYQELYPDQFKKNWRKGFE